MKTFRLNLLWIGFFLFVVSLLGGQTMDSIMVPFPKPFGFTYSSVMSITGILMFICSLFSSWCVDTMKDSEEEELGTVILKTTTKFVFEIVIISFINFLIEALLDPG